MFEPVTREKNKLRLAIDGPSGSGKTYTALRLAFALAGPNGRVAVVDTEHNTASKYEGESPDGIPWSWDGCNLENFSPSTYEQVVKYAGEKGYDVLIIDSLSHAWMGTGGALDQVDRSRSSAGGSFGAWRDVTPQHNAMIDAICRSPCHIIATLRSKMDYVLEPNEKGKVEVKKVGLKPIQREGVEYEFDIVADMNLEHTMRVSKSRCSAVDQQVVHKPDANWIRPVMDWLLSGAQPRPPKPSEEGSAPVTTIVPPIPSSGGVKLGSQKPPLMIDKTQIERIKNLVQGLGWSKDRLKRLLEKRGLKKLSELTRDSADKLIGKLKYEETKKQGYHAF